MSADQYELSSLFQNKIAHASYLEQKFDYILENFRDFGISMLAYGRNSVEEDINVHNHRLMNLLSTAKSYIDGAPQHAQGVLGRNAELSEAVAKLFRKEHSERLGYRVMSELRNHVQHRGLPLYHVQSEPYTGITELANSLDFFISVEQQNEDSSFKKNVLTEIEAIGSVIGIKQFLYEYIEELWAVHQQLRDMLQSTVDEALRFNGSLPESFQTACPPHLTSQVIHLVSRDLCSITTREWKVREHLDAFWRMRNKTLSLREYGAGWLLDQR